MSKSLFVCLLFLSPILLLRTGNAQLQVLEAEQMQEATGTPGICVSVVDVCVDKPKKNSVTDKDIIEDIDAALKMTMTSHSRDLHESDTLRESPAVVLENPAPNPVSISTPATLDLGLVYSNTTVAAEPQPLYIMQELSPPVSETTGMGGFGVSP